MVKDPYKYFRIEARDLVEQLSKSLLDLEKDASTPDLMARMLRLAHTLKGAARVVRQREIADSAHAIEDCLLPYRDKPEGVPREEFNRVLSLIDSVSARVAELAAPPEETSKTTTTTAVVPVFQTFRADVGEVDDLLGGITNAQVQLASLAHSNDAVQRLRHVIDLLGDQIASPQVQRQTGGASAKLRSLAEELPGLAQIVARGLSSGLEQVDRELRQVREIAERLRLLPVHLMFNALERTARDAAQSLGKKVVFETKGGDIRMDADVLNVVQNALVQVVRNAVAHGVEVEADRVTAGKSREGKILFAVSRRGNRVTFLCRDDGRGVDLEAVRKRAISRGISPVDIANHSTDQLLTLLLSGGISTSRTVSEVAGRGVGLDVIREATERFNGSVRIHTEWGKGTTFEITVPVSLASTEALVVKAGTHVVAIPVDAIRRTVRLDATEIAHSSEGASILFEQRVVPFALLVHSLDPNERGSRIERKMWSAILVEAGDSLVAVGVDRLLGTENVVVRPLPKHTPADSVVAGVCLDSEGNPQIVLDPEQLITRVRTGIIERNVPTAPRLPVLVVDDSMTTRMLEKSILESAGYDVDVASSGEEGLEKAHTKTFGLFLVDVEMPGIDGFTFIERVRADPSIRDIPAILVTSRNSPEDRARGLAVGANGHIVKSEFDQADLLTRIRRLVG